MAPSADWSRRTAVAAAVAAAFVGLTPRGTEAHKVATSPYTYNQHIFPILRDRCGRCHIEGGPAPMSLVTYKGAYPWATSIREQLTAQRMPPSFVDPSGPAVRGENPITTREIDMIITWAAGGTPEGDAAAKPPAVALSTDWPLGAPDAKLELPEVTLPANVTETVRDVSIPAGNTTEKWVKAIDLHPGNPTIVRQARIVVENGPVLAVWEPGQDAVAAPPNAAFRLPAGARLQMQIAYKKPWFEEQSAQSDRTTVGLYFADAAVSEIKGLPLDAAAGLPADGRSARVAEPMKVVAVDAAVDRPYAALDIHAVTPDGTRVPLLRLRAPRPEWSRRYWLRNEVDIPPGSTIEATTTDRTVNLDETSQTAAKPRPFSAAVQYVMAR